MCRELKILEIAFNFYLTLSNCHENCLHVFWATMLVTWNFLASFLLHAKYVVFPCRKRLSYIKSSLFFSLSFERNARETEMKKERLLACVQTPPPLRKNRRNRVFLRGGGVLYTG